MKRIITLNFQKFFFNDWNERALWAHLFCNEFGPRDHIANDVWIAEFRSPTHSTSLYSVALNLNSSIRSEQHLVNFKLNLLFSIGLKRSHLDFLIENQFKIFIMSWKDIKIPA